MTPPSPVATARLRIGTLTNTLMVAGGYLLSRVLGLARDVIISNQFGTSAQLDAFRATFGVIDMIYIVIAGGALGSAFIPVFAGMLADRRDDAWRLASAILNLALIGLISASVLVGIFAEPIVASTVGRGFSAETRALTVDLLRLTLIQPLLLGIGGLAKATLESFDRFGIPALGANLYNLGIIGGALLAPWLGVYGLVLGVAFGAVLFLAIQIPSLVRIGARYTRRAWIDTAGVRQIGRLIGPRLFGQAVWQINLIAVASFASLAGPGAVAANGYALQLMLLPHGLLALSVGTVIFPQLARLNADGDHAGFREQAMRALRAVLFVAIPASAILGVLATPVVRLLFERGAFTAESTALTTQVLDFYLFGLVAFTASEILVRTFYAMQDTRTPVIIGCVAVLVNIGLGYTFLHNGAGLGGLAFAFSIANTIEAMLLTIMLRNRIGGFGRNFWRALAFMLISGVCCLSSLFIVRTWSGARIPFISPNAIYHWPQDFPALALWTVSVGGFGAAIYAGLTVIFRVPELRGFIDRIRRPT
ncbi:MAG: murein biosynthesis integral membrane protein MurJ [Roseiflexaceae bacterium]|nr:murein biosynthesis integral membrane protein MurJ [Roseiflexaceae bacterium]